MKLQAFDSSYFRVKNHFEDDGTQNYLVFQPISISILQKIANIDHISAWKSKKLSNENIKAPAASNNSLALVLIYINTKSQVKLDLSCIKQVKLTFTHKQVVNIYIFYEINLWPFAFGEIFVEKFFI